MYGVPNYSAEQEELIHEEERGMNMVRFAEVLGFQGYRLPDTRVMQRCELNTVGKAWCIFVSHRFLLTKNLARVSYDRLRYICAIKRGYNIDIGKMIVYTFDIMLQPWYTGGVGMVGIITKLCTRAGVPPHRTDVMVQCGRKVNPATIEKFTRPQFAQPQVGRGSADDVEEELPMDQP